MVTDNNVPINSIQKKDFKIGDLLLKANAITNTQLKLAINIHSQKSTHHSKTLGNIFIKLGYVSKDVLNKALESCYKERGDIGDHLLEKALITEDQLAKARKDEKASGKMLGEQLISSGYIAEGLFYNILKNEIDFNQLQDHLLQKKIIDQEQIDKAETINRIGHRLGETLVNEGFISDEQLKKMLSLQFSLPFKRLDKYIILESDKNTLFNIISKELSQSYFAIPYAFNQNRVDVALCDITFINEIKSQEKISGYNFHCCMVLDKDFKSLFQDLYSRVSAQEAADQIMKNLVKTNKSHSDQDIVINEESYPSEFIRSHALFIQKYFNALKKVGFSENQALAIVGEEAGIKYPGRPSVKKRTDNIAEFFNVIIADPETEEESVSTLFQNYIKAKITSGENVSGMRKEIFEEFLIQNTKEIKKLKNCNTTKCSVIIKNGATKILLIEN